MNKQVSIIISIAALIIVLGGLLMYAEPEPNTHTGTDNGPKVENILTPDKGLYDFGTISMKNGKVKTSFLVKNNQAEPVQINKLYTSCMCTEATLRINEQSEGPFGMPGHGAFPTFKQELATGQEAEIEVVFDPNAHGPSGVGIIERAVILEGNSYQLTSVQIRANVTP